MRQIRSFLSNAACLTIGLVASLSCTTAVDPTPIGSISVFPPLDSIEVGGTYGSWTVIVKDAQGRTITGHALTWESANPEVATVDPSTGVVTAVGTGETPIFVRGGGQETLVAIRVLVPVAGIVATPDSFDLPLTTNRTIGLQIFGADGLAMTNRAVVWSTGNPSVAVVSATGVVTPIGIGNTTVTAHVQNLPTKRDSVRVRVIGEPVTSVRIQPQQPLHILRLTQSKQLTAECLNALGQVLTGRPVAWVSTNPLVATVNENGLVAGIGVGSANIGATCDNAAGSVASFTVTLVPVTSVSVVPTEVTMITQRSQQLTPIPRDSAGNALSLVGRSVVWSSSNTAIMSLTQQGVIFSESPGISHVTVTIDGVTSPIVVVTINAPFAMSSTPPWMSTARQSVLTVDR
jgi:uncharacterized protein YjdB